MRCRYGVCQHRYPALSTRVHLREGGEGRISGYPGGPAAKSRPWLDGLVFFPERPLLIPTWFCNDSRRASSVVVNDDARLADFDEMGVLEGISDQADIGLEQGEQVVVGNVCRWRWPYPLDSVRLV